MRVVMTLLVRNEADVVDAQLAFHLNAGVDFVIATDHGSDDGTREILNSYAQLGLLHLIDQRSPERRQGDWVTRMARLAATDFGADWVINSDADEFWWPRGGDLKEVLSVVPMRYGVVRAFWRPFPPRPGDGFFADRMTVRLSPLAPINDPLSPYRPSVKVAHRASPEVVVGYGNHSVEDPELIPLRGWYPIELLHFPLRGLEQYERKLAAVQSAGTRDAREFGAGYHRKAREAYRRGELADYVDSIGVDDDALERGLADGSLVVDTRLQDALRVLHSQHARGPRQFLVPSEGVSLTFPRPNVVDEAAYAVDIATLGEANVVRLQRTVDELEARLAGVERRPSNRLRRRLLRIARR
jgi:Glycosyl transferase family 2